MPATNGQPTDQELAMMMQQASPGQSQLPYVNSSYPTEDESQLDYIMPQ